MKKKLLCAVIFLAIILSLSCQSFATPAPKQFTTSDWSIFKNLRNAVEANDQEGVVAFNERFPLVFDDRLPHTVEDARKLLDTADQYYVALIEDHTEFWFVEVQTWGNVYTCFDISTWRFSLQYYLEPTPEKTRSEPPDFFLQLEDGTDIPFYYNDKIYGTGYEAILPWEDGYFWFIIDINHDSGLPPIETIGKIQIRSFYEMTSEPKKNETLLYVLAPCAAGVLLGGGVVTFLLLRKRKRKQKIAEES